MPTIGEQLRAAREARGLEIEDAHRHTKIHTKILRAMEEDRATEVLDPTYAKGFLRKYATFLNLDPGSLVDEYVKAESSPSMVSLTQTTLRPSSPPPPSRSLPPWLLPAVIGLMAVIGVVFLGILTRDLSKTVATATSAQTPTSSPAAVKPAPAPAPPPKPLVPKSQPLKLSIKASQDCWMQVKADDKVLFQNVLGKGHQELWTANEAIELWVGNAAALTLTLNGRALEPLGLGVLKGIRVTRFGLQLPKSSRRSP